MARYNGPKTKISRIFGEPILGNGKWLGKNSNPPGQHGEKRKRKTLGEYALQLREKQKVKRIYFVLEKQFRNYFEKARRQKGVTGENLLFMLERRLDNVVYRSGFSTSRRQARQLVNHGHIAVNGRKVNIPSFQVRAGDTIAVKDRTQKNTHVEGAWQTAVGRGRPGWLSTAADDFTVTVSGLPKREDVDANINEQLIVELYSK